MENRLATQLKDWARVRPRGIPWGKLVSFVVGDLQRSVFVIIMGSPDLERSNLIGISEKQGTCSRT